MPLGHHALRYELTTMKSSTRGRRSLRDIRQKKKPSQRSQPSDVEQNGCDYELTTITRYFKPIESLQNT